MGAVGAGLGYGATSGAAGLVGSALMGAGTLGAGLLAAGPLAAGLAGAGATYAGLRLHHALTAGGPSEAYNRKKHYGSTPTKADRKHFGATPAQVVDHGPPLVQRYYESARPVLNAIYPWAWKPGYEQSQEERRASGTDRSAMQLQAKAASHQQGAEMSQYSKQMKKYHDL